MKDYTYKKLGITAESSSFVLAEWQRVHTDTLYSIDTSRERMSPALSATRAYHLRRPAVPKGSIVTTISAQNVLACEDTPLFKAFPALREFIQLVGEVHSGTGWKHLGRVFITELAAGGNIGRHIDHGTYFENLHRHHFVLVAQQAEFCWDNDVSVQLRAGELWRVNNSVPHWVKNSGGPRTHIIFDAA